VKLSKEIGEELVKLQPNVLIATHTILGKGASLTVYHRGKEEESKRRDLTI